MNRRELHETFDRLLDAIAAETAAKEDKKLDNEARSAAQQKVMDIMHQLQKETGLRDLLQRRIVVDIRGIANGTPVLATALPAKASDYHEEAGKRLLRSILTRVALDSGTLPDVVEGRISAEMLFAEEGYVTSGAFGVLSEPVPRAGRTRTKGLDEAFRLAVVARVGYTAGYEGLGVKHRLTQDILKRVQAWVKRECRQHGYTFEGDVPSRDALRLWCSDEGGKKKEFFETTYRSGCVDKAAGSPPHPDLFLA